MLGLEVTSCPSKENVLVRMTCIGMTTNCDVKTLVSLCPWEPLSELSLLPSLDVAVLVDFVPLNEKNVIFFLIIHASNYMLRISEYRLSNT